MKNMIDGERGISFDEREVIIMIEGETEMTEVVREGKTGRTDGASKEGLGVIKDGEEESTETLIEEEEIVLVDIMK